MLLLKKLFGTYTQEIEGQFKTSMRFKPINGIRDVPMEQMSTVKVENPFMSSLKLVQKSAVEKGEGGKRNASPLCNHPVEGLFLS